MQDERFREQVPLDSLAVDEQQNHVVLSHPLWADQMLNISQSQMRKYRKLLLKGKDSVRIRIVFRDEHFWIIFPKENFTDEPQPTAVESQTSPQTGLVEFSAEDGHTVEVGIFREQQRFNASNILLPNGSKFNSSSKIGELVKPEYLASLGLPQTIIAARFVSQHKKAVFSALHHFEASSKKVSLLSDILGLWHSTLEFRERHGPPYKGYITNESTGNFFGFSPGFPQLVLRDSDVDGGSLAVGIEITFSEFEMRCEHDGLTRTFPTNVISPLPDTPNGPYVISLNSVDIAELSSKTTAPDGTMLWDTAPIAVVLEKDVEGKAELFAEMLDRFSVEHNLSHVMESEKAKKKYPLTYQYLETWSLLYKPQQPLDALQDIKHVDWFGNFPIPLSPRYRKPGFNWIKAARGRVHDLAHDPLIQSEKERRQGEWILIGDETGSGYELLHADNDGDGKPGSARKKLAYIWVLVPPGVELPATPSDFHAMDQKSFKIDHLRALENLERLCTGSCVSFIFESPDFVEEKERHPRGEKEHIPLVIRNTLPLVIDYISTQVPKKSTQSIRIMSERIGENWKPGTDPTFLTSELKRWVSNLRDRGRDVDLRLSGLEIHPKMDHPWMNYPDAVGFLTGKEIPEYLIPHKEKILSNSIQLPYVSSFLGTMFPAMTQQLAENPALFVQGLVERDVKNLTAFKKPFIQSMCNEAFSRFSSLDWRSFNEFMVHQQRRPGGRFIAKMLHNYVDGNISNVLDSLVSHSDRLNMCLTLGWHMDQQGGDVFSFLKLVKRDWLDEASERMRLSWLTLTTMARQNEFNFEIRSAPFVSMGFLENEISTPTELVKLLNEKKNPDSKFMNLCAKLFSFFAFEEQEDPEQLAAISALNEALVHFQWSHQRENRRHAIYGAEWALDFASTAREYFEIAEYNLFQLYHEYLGSGETTSSDPFWWPASTRMFFVGIANGFIEPNDERLSDHLERAILYSQQGPLIVRMRVAYWLYKLMSELQLVPPEGIYESLREIENEFITDSNVYPMLHSSYLLDLHNAYSLGDKQDLVQQFTDRLSASSQSTKDFFAKCDSESQILPGSLLRFNYA